MNARFTTPGVPITDTDLSDTGRTRHAALLLHAMSTVDREWVLGALPPSEREELSTLLAELETLGIARNPDFLAEATEQRTDDTWPKEALVSDEIQLQRLETHRVQALADQLREEPAGLTVELLHAGEWPWRETLLQALDPVHRQRVEAALFEVPPRPATPPALRSALIAAVAARLREQASTPPRPLAAGRLSAWRRSLRVWLGPERSGAHR